MSSANIRRLLSTELLCRSKLLSQNAEGWTFFFVPWIPLEDCQKYILSVASSCWIVRGVLFNMLWKWPNPSMLSGNDSVRKRMPFTEHYSSGLVWNYCWCCNATSFWAWQTSWLGASWTGKTLLLGLTSQLRSFLALAVANSDTPRWPQEWDTTHQSGERKWEYKLGRDLQCFDLHTEASEMTVYSLPSHPKWYFSKWCLNMFISKWVKYCLS